MRLVRANMSAGELSQEKWNELAALLKENKGGLGDLGGGNHFIDALTPRSNDRLHLLIHTGSRHESGHVDDLVGQPKAFDQAFDRVVAWAERNRTRIQEQAQEILGPLDLVLDLPHNTYEKQEGGGAIIRKGAAHVMPGQLNIIPAHIVDYVALVRATDRVKETLFSLSHGTGRAMPTSEAKQLARTYDFEQLRSEVLIPDVVSDASLRGEGPFAYRDLDDCLNKISSYIEVVERFKVVAYMGHL
jgi:RNA-splicing ligase RtcB